MRYQLKDKGDTLYNLSLSLHMKKSVFGSYNLEHFTFIPLNINIYN